MRSQFFARAFARPFIRPLARLALAAAAWSCASAGLPPGGPEDFESPTIVRIRPDTDARNVRTGGVTYSFNRVVSERPQGASDLSGLFLISPSQGRNDVSWRRTTISVSPRGGFKAGTTYTVRMLPGLTDLQGNIDTLGNTLIFSTGPTIASGNIRGILFDWVLEKPGSLAFIEAFPVPTPRDSIRYLAVADSQGRFDLGHVPPGRYLLRGSIDQNKNRILDPREVYDTMTITLADSARREILAFVHDTIGAGLASVNIVDSLTLRVTMDRALDTTLVLDTTRFSLKEKPRKGSNDSLPVGIARVISRRVYDKEREDSLKTKAVQDSLQRLAKSDSAKGRDSLPTPAAPAAPAPSRRIPPPRRVVAQVADSVAGRDSAQKEAPPKPSVPAPTVDIFVRLATPLLPNTSYRLRAIEMRTLLGKSRSSDRVFTTPKRDTTAKSGAGRDSTAKKDSTARRDTTIRPRPDTLSPTGSDSETLSRLDGGMVPAATRHVELPWTPFVGARRTSAAVSAAKR